MFAGSAEILPKLADQTFSRLFTEIRCSGQYRTEEIDYNGHLNNSKYLDWVEELLDSNFYTEKTPKQSVQYVKELREGETAKLRYTWENEVMYVRGIHNGEDSFLVKNGIFKVKVN